MYKIYCVKKNHRINNSIFNNLLSTLPVKQQIIINSKKHIEDKELKLLSQILLRSTLMKKLNCNPEDLNFSIGAFGKPFLESFSNNHFNLSYSGEGVVLVISNKEVGIDIEMEKSIDLDIAKNYFSQTEYDYIKSSKKENQIEVFFKIWTLKESYIKALGLGLSKRFDSFSVIDHKRNCKIVDFNQQNKFLKWTNKHFKIDRKYHVSVCSQKKLLTNSFILINDNQLITDYLSSIKKK